MHAIRIDRSKPLCDEPNCGHNRYHPDIPPAAEIGEGEEIALETRDALDGQITPATTIADFASLNAGAVHPLTGPVFVKGAQPGDMLEIEFTDIIPQPTAFSAIMPGLGFLRDVMTEPFLVHWQIKDDWATSAQLPGVRIPGAPFMGVSAVAPAAEQLAAWTAREQRVIDAGGFALPPDAERRGARRSLRPHRPAHAAAARERRQFRREAAHQRRKTVPAGVQGRRVVLHRRRPFRAGRRRGLRHRGRDGRHRRGALQAAQGAGNPEEIHRAGVLAHDLLRRSALRRAGTVPRRHGHADQYSGRDRGGEPHTRLPQRGAEHDGAAAGTRLQPRSRPT